jgi:hypothetical protein
MKYRIKMKIGFCGRNFANTSMNQSNNDKVLEYNGGSKPVLILFVSLPS